ncbi:succinylglutamate desuccinylase [Labilibaculum filiforme]|uniref:Succinylglutamate desuccinylase n=1 Tax=Labilibaculum filiforme TaxID=1940526 RepID=A0A2N3I120_9BACT|nr:succinylglutamate desuccinylase [Labilibaculum filiforme]
MTNKYTILGKEIKKGERAFLELEVAKLHTRNTIKVPVIVERAKKDGPTLLLMGGVHGDEVNGVAIVRDIIRKKYNKPKTGMIICIPVFNVFGFLNLRREFPDGRDLNRMFPGFLNGSLASQFAYRFTKEIAPKVDYVIDFHSGGADRSNFPQIRCVIKEKKSLKLAQIFNAPFILNSEYISKSVRDTIHNLGKTILLFEGGKSNDLDKDVINCGVEGALNVMRYLGLQNEEPELKNNPVVIPKAQWVRASNSGMFQLRVTNGSWVLKKQILGEITDPYGGYEKKVFAPFDCYVFCVNTAPIVHKGDALFHISLEIEKTKTNLPSPTNLEK